MSSLPAGEKTLFGGFLLDRGQIADLWRELLATSDKCLLWPHASGVETVPQTIREL
jgi:hypothetical protein